VFHLVRPMTMLQPAIDRSARQDPPTKDPPTKDMIWIPGGTFSMGPQCRADCAKCRQGYDSDRKR